MGSDGDRRLHAEDGLTEKGSVSWYNFLLELPRSDDAKEPVFPKLFDKPGTGKSGLSMSFKRLMQRAGIDDGVARKHYTHLELETVRRAVESISRLPGKASDDSQLRTR